MKECDSQVLDQLFKLVGYKHPEKFRFSDPIKQQQFWVLSEQERQSATETVQDKNLPRN